MPNEFQIGDMVKLKPDQPISGIQVGVPIEVVSINGNWLGLPCEDSYTPEIASGQQPNWGYQCFELVERRPKRIYKFRVGDRVVRASDAGGFWPHGHVGVVSHVERDCFSVSGDARTCSYHYWELTRDNPHDILTPEENKALIASALAYGTNTDTEVANDEERIGNADQVSEDRIAVS